VDVVCLGGGGAAVAAAVTAARLGGRIALVSKEPVGYGDTRISLGFTLYPNPAGGDSPEALLADLLVGGEHLNSLQLTELIALKAGRAVEMVEEFGHLYRRDREGNISRVVFARSGGHRISRTLSCPPGGGVAIANALRAAVQGLVVSRTDLRHAGVLVMEETVACRLLLREGRIAGVVCLDLARGETVVLECGALVMATGGAGWLYYPNTDCTRGATGDGYALAAEAGAELQDMEQVQFIPFGFTHPSSIRGIHIGEPSIAGPRGVLKNGEGKVVLADLHRMTRAAVTRVMALELQAGRTTPHGGLWLDLSGNLQEADGRQLWEQSRQRWAMDCVRRAYGERAYRWEEPWEVVPTSHYCMGGLVTDAHCATRVPGLYAAGQVQGGIHGANRLGSVSLAEVFIFGEIAGREALAFSRRHGCPASGTYGEEIQAVDKLFGRRGEETPVAVKGRLHRLMWEQVGLMRHRAGLLSALAEIARLREQAAQTRVVPERRYNPEILDVLELSRMLDVAEMITAAALLREETRGAHLREDFPEPVEALGTKNVVQWMENDRLQTGWREVKAV